MATNLEDEFCDTGWSEDYDCIPLRLKMLRARVHDIDDRISSFSVQKEECKLTPPQSISVHHSEDDNCHLESKGSSECHVSEEIPMSEVKTNVVGKPVKVEDGVVSHLTLAETSADVNIPVFENLVGFNSGLEKSSAVKHDLICEFDDNHDDLVLQERRIMLLSRKSSQSVGSCIKDQVNYGRLSNSSKEALQGPIVDVQFQKSVNFKNMLIDKSICPGLNGDHGTSGTGINETRKTVKKPSVNMSDCLHASESIESKGSATSLQSNMFIKPETTMTNMNSMAVTVPARVKHEPVDISDFCSERTNGMRKSFTGEMLPVKSEHGLPELFGDELDHLPLVDRIKLLTCGTSILDKSQSVKIHDENVASALDIGIDVESVKPIRICRPRKKRKTATNSVGTALEEDAPEILKLLIERGISVEEIKLYGEEESEDALDESFTEDSFGEFEAVVSQLFSQRQSFLKFPPLRFTKGEKANYCVSCLLSLVEQTRYLQNRKWPVEWGWCRDLQSFIFVFQGHNRIVLERPEYGFATYFFELLNSMPVHWQVKRLVTTMKLTSCGRFTLIENRPLVVGEDLGEGEARVLAEYGWTPNTGLGTMLNYCDRVVHDRKQEINSLEWRSKIGKQLMIGYNGGHIISNELTNKSEEYQSSSSVQVKLEEE